MAGHKITKKRKDLKYYYDQFMGVKEAQGISDAQNYDYQTQMKIFLNASHNSVDYDTLNQDVLDFFSAIPDTSPARFNKPYNLINCFLNWLVDEEVIKANPIKKNKIKKRVDEGNIHPVQIDDLKKFLKVIPEDEIVGFRNKCIIYVMLDTGMRTCEILRIHDNSLDLKNKRIILTQQDTKTKRERIVYLKTATCTMLKDWLEIKPDNWQDYLFPNYEGKKLNINRLDIDFKKYSEESGVKITPYQLRHTYASMVAEEGCDAFLLQQMMGHSNMSMTKRYIELKAQYKQSKHDEYSPINKLTATQRKKKISK